MKMAMGMVAAMVNVPHGLPFSAFTTTSPITASRIKRITVLARIPNPASRCLIPVFLCLVSLIFVGIARGFRKNA